MQKDGPIQSFAANILAALKVFAGNEADGKQALNQLASSDPSLFFAAGIRVVAAAEPSDGSRYLILALAKDKRLSLGLLDPNVCTVGEAVAVSRAAAAAGAQLQSTFQIGLNKALQGQASPQNAGRILRLLDVLAATCDPNCWPSFQVELMAYPDKFVRSKAAFLIGRSTRNASWIGRRLLDRDPRVQASAVEALWGLDSTESKPHLLSALKSANSRVAANAGLGLYYIGDVTALRYLLDMLQHSDPAFHLSAMWAIGETKDERFLPALVKYYRHAEGKLRLATVGAMSRIRRREKTAQAGDPIQVHVREAVLQADGRRRLTFALSCHPAKDLSGFKPTEFVAWENGTPIQDYEVRLATPPALLIAGFVAPWFASDEEPYEKLLREAWKQCLTMKRRDDYWRIDRYSLDMNSQAGEKASSEPMPPYDDALMTPDVKTALGSISQPDLLEKVFALAVPPDRAAADPGAALQRQTDALVKRSGQRHVFILLHEMPGFNCKPDTMARLEALAKDGSFIFHALCPQEADRWAPIRELCSSHPEGSFIEAKPEGMLDALVDAYANLSNRFEIGYTLPASVPPGPVRLKISSERGCGEAEISLQAPPAPEPAPPAAPVSAVEAPVPST
jgi:hypothetical protein